MLKQRNVFDQLFFGFLVILTQSCGLASTPISKTSVPPGENLISPSPTIQNDTPTLFSVTPSSTVTVFPQPSINYPIIPGDAVNSTNISKLALLGIIPERTYPYSPTTGRVDHQLEWSPDSREIALSSNGSGIRFIDPLLMEDIGGIEEVEGSAINFPGPLAFTPDGTSLAVVAQFGANNGYIKIIFVDPTTKNAISNEIVEGSEIFMMEYNHRGDMLATSSLFGTGIYGPDHKAIYSYGEHLLFVDFITFSWDDRYFVFRGDYGTRMVDTKTFTFVDAFDQLQLNGVLCFSPDGKYFAHAPGFWSLDNLSLNITPNENFIFDICNFGMESDIVFTYNSTEDKIGIWQVETGKLLREIIGEGHSIFDIALSPDGRFLAIAKGSESDAQGTVEVWGIA